MNYKYEVALSFAGEDRAFAESVAKGLREAGVEVFYDNFYAEELWGEDLSIKLQEIYSSVSRYCVMILSDSYLKKMWTNFERQQAIERLIKQKGESYVLPVRLDNFNDNVQGLSNLIGYLTVNSNDSKKVVQIFLKKVKKTLNQQVSIPTKSISQKPYIPKLKKSFTDKEKNNFLKLSFDEIINTIDMFAAETTNVYPQLEHEIEKITSRKALFTLYDNGEEKTSFVLRFDNKFGKNSITFSYGNDITNDNSANEIISLEEVDSELKLKLTMGFDIFESERDKPMSPKEVAEHLWKMVFKYF